MRICSKFRRRSAAALVSDLIVYLGSIDFCYVRCGPLIMHENQQPQTEAFELSAAEREAIEHEMHHYEDPRAASIEALKIVQKQRGWVPDGARSTRSPMCWVFRQATSKVWQRSTAQIFRQPVGRHVIRYCDSVVCHINGYQWYSGGAREKAKHQTSGKRHLTVALRCCQLAAWGTVIKGQT